MLKLRKEQIVIFETLFNKKFRADVLMHAREDLAEETESMSDEDIDFLIDDAVTRAYANGISFERNIMLFFDLLILKGRHFDKDRKNQWINKILTDNDLDENAKMDTIYLRLAAIENRETEELEEMG
jgi:U3 small nucleolar ribonucleoprotein component